MGWCLFILLVVVVVAVVAAAAKCESSRKSSRSPFAVTQASQEFSPYVVESFQAIWLFPSMKIMGFYYLAIKNIRCIWLSKYNSRKFIYLDC